MVAKATALADVFGKEFKIYKCLRRHSDSRIVRCLPRGSFQLW